MEDKIVKIIENAGGCLVSKNILSGKGKLKWLVREESINEIDNGWRFFSNIDDDLFCSNSNNFEVCDFNTVANIEPAVLGIYLFPTGSDLQLVNENGQLQFYDNLTGNKVEMIYSI